MNVLQEATNRLGLPFYFYDLDGFESHLQSIKAILHPEIKVWYACKANPLGEVLKILKKNGFGADVASLGELQQARNCGYEENDLIATGPAKSRSYLASLLQARVKCIIIESFNQLKDLNELCGKLSIKQDVLLRVQFPSEDTNKSVLGGGSITPFGLGPEDWLSLDLKAYPHLNFVGLHSFQWGNVLDINQLKTHWEYTILSCKNLAFDLGIDLKVMDLGGGLGLSYSDQRELAFAEVHKMLVDLKQHYEIPEVWLELGRFAIGKFGSYLTRIVDIKMVRGKNLIITEGGINHLARPALVGESFPAESLIPSTSPTTRYSVHGPLCTALDTLGEYNLPEDLKIGDWLVFKRTGAYGFTESMPYFLCHNLAGEAVVYQGELMVARMPKTNLEWMV